MKISPLSGYVLIEPIKDQDITSSGLALPEKAQDKPEKGKVISVGAPKLEEPADYFGPIKLKESKVSFPPFGLKGGDVVIFHKWSGQDVKDGDKEYKLVKFADLMAIYE